MNVEIIIFYIFSLLLLSSSIAVVTVNNPVKSAISLVFAFFSSAVLWLLLNAEFLSIILILVYVGAVMVLFLFVVMMLDINISQAKEGFVKYFSIGFFVFITIAGFLSYFFYNQFQLCTYLQLKNHQIRSIQLHLQSQYYWGKSLRLHNLSLHHR